LNDLYSIPVGYGDTFCMVKQADASEMHISWPKAKGQKEPCYIFIGGSGMHFRTCQLYKGVS